jgi:hypothetical protein
MTQILRGGKANPLISLPLDPHMTGPCHLHSVPRHIYIPVASPCKPSQSPSFTVSEQCRIHVQVQSGLIRVFLYIVKPRSVVPGYIIFLDPSFNFYGLLTNLIIIMVPTSVVFPYPSFVFRTPQTKTLNRSFTVEQIH